MLQNQFSKIIEHSTYWQWGSWATIIHWCWLYLHNSRNLASVFLLNSPSSLAKSAGICIWKLPSMIGTFSTRILPSQLLIPADSLEAGVRFKSGKIETSMTGFLASIGSEFSVWSQKASSGLKTFWSQTWKSSRMFSWLHSLLDSQYGCWFWQ